MKFNYTTTDGHKMRVGEVMWRVRNDAGYWHGLPGKVIYSDVTGYNCLVLSGPLTWDGVNPPFPHNQIHFSNYERAMEFIKNN